MRRAVEKLKKDNKKAAFILQLTAMVDMFTIIIVFLLKSYSTSAVNITPNEDLKLPQSTSVTDPVEGLKLIVSLEGIFIDDKKVVEFKEGNIKASSLDANDAEFIPKLFEELDKHAEKSKKIAEVNSEFKFKGEVVMQADSRLDYGLLKKVMYTSSMAGFSAMKFATISME